jgi:hypothetical protein
MDIEEDSYSEWRKMAPLIYEYLSINDVTDFSAISNARWAKCAHIG